MQGRRPEPDHRFTFHASRFDKLTVPSQVEGRFTVLGSGPRTTHDGQKTAHRLGLAGSKSDIAVCDEAKEVRPDARPQARG